MAHETCKICKEKKATPSHVNAAHGMKFNEYKNLTADPEFMKEVEEHKKIREERVDKEYHRSRILIYRWYPESRALTRVLGKFTNHAKTTAKALNLGTDLSEFVDKDTAIVGTVIIADALIKDGWECTMTKGGMDKRPKEYHMKRL
jgi:hypothetical protein